MYPPVNFLLLNHADAKAPAALGPGKRWVVVTQTLLVYLSDVKHSVLNGVSTPPAPRHTTEEAQEECEGQRKAASVMDHCLLSMTLTLLS